MNQASNRRPEWYGKAVLSPCSICFNGIRAIADAARQVPGARSSVHNDRYIREELWIRELASRLQHEGCFLGNQYPSHNLRSMVHGIILPNNNKIVRRSPTAPAPLPATDVCALRRLFAGGLSLNTARAAFPSVCDAETTQQFRFR